MTSAEVARKLHWDELQGLEGNGEIAFGELKTSRCEPANTAGL